jgi:UDP-N-acetylmuramate--alanine ligase
MQQKGTVMGLSGKQIHFMGISGIGMSAIAELAIREGAQVSGCDLAINDNSRRLEGAGITVELGHNPEHITGHLDLLVYSSAVPADNSERIAAAQAGIETVSRSCMLARLMAERRSIGVAGTHGKTSTTWLAARILLDSGLDPAVMVGGVVPELGSNFHNGSGEWFVTEVDESDGLLLEIRPEVSILLNIDRDHLEHYSGIDEIENIFREYVGNTVPGGVIIGCVEDQRVAGLLAESKFKTIGYGIDTGTDAEVRAVNVRLSGENSRFDLLLGQETFKDVSTRQLGRHSVLNALAAASIGYHLGIEAQVIIDSLASAGGVRRRMELLAEKNGIRIYNDYGHHPTEVAAAIAAARLLLEGGGRLVTVFQPHRYSRTRHLMEEFAGCFAGTEHLVITSIYAANEAPIAGVTAAVLAEKISASGHKSVQYVPSGRSVVAHVASVAKKGDVVLMLGAGDVWELYSELIEAI